MVREKILQGQGNVREFNSGAGKIDILKIGQGKLKLYDIEGWFAL